MHIRLQKKLYLCASFRALRTRTMLALTSMVSHKKYRLFGVSVHPAPRMQSSSLSGARVGKIHLGVASGVGCLTKSTMSAVHIQKHEADGDAQAMHVALERCQSNDTALSVCIAGSNGIRSSHRCSLMAMTLAFSGRTERQPRTAHVVVQDTHVECALGRRMPSTLSATA